MKAINVDSLDELRRYYSVFEVIASEVSLTNLFMWRFKYGFHYDISDGFLWVINVKDEKTYYFSQPIGDYHQEEALISSIKAIKNKYGDVVIKKSDDRLIAILKKCHLEFEVVEDRDSFDYIYDADELAQLPGNRFHKKKNHVNRFVKLYPDWRYEALCDDNIEDVLKMNEIWFKDRDVADNPDYQSERIAILEALKHREYLDFSGGVLRVGDAVAAYTLGEMLNQDTLVIHIEKADTRYQGSYAMINQQYLLHQSRDFTKVNREQDLGIEGLRKAKLSYQPIGFVEKFIIKLL